MKIKNKKIIYIDMDNVLTDFKSGIDLLSNENKIKYKKRYDEAPDIFRKMAPMRHAIYSFEFLYKYFDVYILTTSPWENNKALGDKLFWIKKHLGKKSKKRVIFSHYKNLLNGDYIIDDRTKNGVSKFKGEHIHFGKDPYFGWLEVLDYMITKIDDINVRNRAKAEKEQLEAFERSIDWEFINLRMDYLSEK